MLTQNSELRPLGIHNWTIPAYAFRRDNGEKIGRASCMERV